MNSLCIESFCPQKMLFSRTLLKHSHHFDYWNQALNVRMCVCFVDCREAGVCCYLMIHLENLLHPFQLIYLHFVIYLLTPPLISDWHKLNSHINNVNHMWTPSFSSYFCDITAVGSDITGKVTTDACSASWVNSVRRSDGLCELVS
jgi:hypothetical protein